MFVMSCHVMFMHRTVFVIEVFVSAIMEIVNGAAYGTQAFLAGDLVNNVFVETQFIIEYAVFHFTNGNFRLKGIVKDVVFMVKTHIKFVAFETFSHFAF